MKKLIGLGLVLIASTTFAQMKSLPNGQWFGKGYWKAANGEMGKYRGTITIRGNAMTEKLTFIGKEGETQEETHTTNFKFNEQGFITTTGDKKTEGRGYCGLKRCHVDGQSEEGTHEVSFIFKDRFLFMFGSMRHKDYGYFFWESAFAKKKKPAPKPCVFKAQINRPFRANLKRCTGLQKGIYLAPKAPAFLKVSKNGALFGKPRRPHLGKHQFPVAVKVGDIGKLFKVTVVVTR